ncbi:hypothetical protein DSECCO2_660660 [anaerobic digester metagenome]
MATTAMTAAIVLNTIDSIWFTLIWLLPDLRGPGACDRAPVQVPLPLLPGAGSAGCMRISCRLYAKPAGGKGERTYGVGVLTLRRDGGESI